VQPFPDELQITETARTGELRMDAAGRIRAHRQPGHASGEQARLGPGPKDALRFPVRTPATPGPHRLRSSIYYRNTLVQSRVVTAWVGRAPASGKSLTAIADVSLARITTPADLEPIRAHSLSILVNDNGDATHSFRFVSATDVAGAAAVVTDPVILASALGDLIKQARGSMRTIAWGSPEPWTATATYRYGSGKQPDFRADLIELVREGRHAYDALINDVAGGPDAASALRKRMAVPGRVQVVSKGSPSELIPASIFYDYQNAAVERPDITVCPQFEQDRQRPEPLEESACFRGACPSVDTPQVICPSGFWGYRHAIGMPVVVRYVPPFPTELPHHGPITLGVAVYPGFDLWSEHRKRLEAMGGWSVRVVETLDATIDLLKAHSEHVVYFYCHGGTTPGNVPFILVGPEGGPPLVRSALRWDAVDRYALPRTLVILNGCQTTALEPDRAIDFVTAFIQNVGAVGVIGTEITVFEELATAFGELLFAQLGTGIEIGEAVRRARLALLKEGNPLGLVYLPMVQADARLVVQA
jgi:hypothetical protein